MEERLGDQPGGGHRLGGAPRGGQQQIGLDIGEHAHRVVLPYQGNPQLAPGCDWRDADIRGTGAGALPELLESVVDGTGIDVSTWLVRRSEPDSDVRA
ncbi:hypothetical protein Cci01nite_00030 [Catellatospora citrea]|uniref:Uncharacterized protein n=1 Tax=Catellatospora citrea TaxID=53366 RepID=A0A8J3KFF2_9ACTN|nr:hypothetical protein Cci01nite_00030 [Catellatospora citrea]